MSEIRAVTQAREQASELTAQANLLKTLASTVEGLSRQMRHEASAYEITITALQSENDRLRLMISKLRQRARDAWEEHNATGNNDAIDKLFQEYLL